MTGSGANSERNNSISIQIENFNKSAHKSETKYLYEIEKEVYAISLKQKNLKFRGCSETNESLKSDYLKENEFKMIIGSDGHDGILINKNLPISRFLLNKIISNKEISNEETKKNSNNKYSEKSDMNLTEHKSVSSENEKIKLNTEINKYVMETEDRKSQDSEEIPVISQSVQVEKKKRVVKILEFKANEDEGKKIAKPKRRRRLTQVIRLGLDDIICINEKNLEVCEGKTSENTQAVENLDSNIIEKVESNSALLNILRSNTNTNKGQITKIDEGNKISDKNSFVDKISKINSTNRKSPNETNLDEEYCTENCIRDSYKEKSTKEKVNGTDTLNNIQVVENKNSDFEAFHESISANANLYTHLKNIGNTTNISNEKSFRNTENSTAKGVKFILIKSESEKIWENTAIEVNNHIGLNIKEKRSYRFIDRV